MTSDSSDQGLGAESASPTQCLSAPFFWEPSHTPSPPPAMSLSCYLYLLSSLDPPLLPTPRVYFKLALPLGWAGWAVTPLVGAPRALQFQGHQAGSSTLYS